MPECFNLEKPSLTALSITLSFSSILCYVNFLKLFPTFPSNCEIITRFIKPAQQIIPFR